MIELLESRIAPAAVLSYFEVDGDKVTIKTSKGTRADLEAATGISQGSTSVSSVTLDLIDTAALAEAFAGTDLKITAHGGHGVTANQVDDVTINAFDANDANNIDLGHIVIKGDLDYIDAGDSDLSTLSVKSIKATNWGPTENASSATSSQIFGNIGSITVTNDFNGYIYSNSAAGSANYQDSDGTVIKSFTAKNFANLNGSSVGFLQVASIGDLTIKNVFFGSTNGSTNNGLIEAVTIGHIDIGAMRTNASIVLG